MKNKLPTLIVILGPTASGKTNLAIKMAKKFGGEIVNADSRAIYKEMKVATARPKKSESGVRHHLVGYLVPNSEFSLAKYKKLAVDKINDILIDFSPREQEILRMRFGLADGVTHTLEEVGKKFGVTRERIRQIEAKTLEKIKKHKKSTALEEY